MSKKKAITTEFAPDSRDLINQLLGQAQALSAASNLLQTFGVAKLAMVKEQQLYKGLAGTRAPNGLELRGTWEEFCGLLGVSDEKANQDIANLRAFGEEALESMTRLGVGYRELRQFRKLPEDKREQLSQLALAGTKEDVLEAAYEAIESANKEAQQAQGQLADATADLDAAQRREANLGAELERANARIARLTKSRAQVTTLLERTEDVRAECLALHAMADLQLTGLRKQFDEVLGEPSDGQEWQLRIEQIWITANTVAAQATALIEHMRSACPTDLPERIHSQHLMTPAEAKRWVLDYQMVVNLDEAAKADRKDQREAAKPRGPGRPAGSKAKKGDTQ